jgi:hypothetical protein
MRLIHVLGHAKTSMAVSVQVSLIIRDFVAAINIVICMCDQLTCCDTCAHSHLYVASHLSLSAVVDCVAPQVTFCLLNFVQPINFKS